MLFVAATGKVQVNVVLVLASEEVKRIDRTSRLSQMVKDAYGCEDLPVRANRASYRVARGAHQGTIIRQGVCVGAEDGVCVWAG